MWAWERFANLRPTPNVMERGEPRSARWNRVKIVKVKDVRAALDSGKESFMWRPYSIASNNCMLSKLCRDYEQWVIVDSDDTESFARCLRVSELVGLGCIEQYLPHRVAMQFGLDQDVPAYVIQSNQSRETAWSNYSRPIRGMKIYIPPRLFEADVSSGYMDWWSGLRGVNEESPTSCIQNVKHFVPGSAEERSEDYVEEDNIPIAQLVRRSSSTKNSGKRFILDNEPVSNTKNSGKRFILDNEPVMNTFYGDETSMSSICRTEPVKSSVQSTRFSGKCKNRHSAAKRLKESEPEEDKVVRKTICHAEANTVNFKDSTTSELVQVKLQTLEAPGCPSESVKERQEDEDVVDEDTLTISQLLSQSINKGCLGKLGCGDDELELSKQSISSSGKCKKSKSSTEKPIDLEEDAISSKANHHEVNDNNVALASDKAVIKASCPERNIVNTVEESSDNASELPRLGLEARIWRLEKIFDLIKAEKLDATSKDNLEK
ncbi:uncharacterized protein LOC141717547 [Apium graveolens]|uniref:uncharacterized protein LOC141717547 n=1 Tax=Apium graveolens TaxID=4045 RepID=UPI003D78F318